MAEFKRLFGTETEYGLQIEGRGAREQVEDSADFINCCELDAFLGWDYAFESPRCDIRGFEVDRLQQDPIDAQFDAASPGGSNFRVRTDHVLTNGARFYNDHGHPEYSTPECARIADLVAHELAGEMILQRTAERYTAKYGRKATVYKNNTDYHGASYGSHESYLVSRDMKFGELMQALLPLFITRPILVGAGKVGSDAGAECEYQISQRADFISEEANVETLYRRPIFNTRDEPHADPNRFLRLHVICGDANRMPWCIAMKSGLVLLALELAALGESPKWVIRDAPAVCSRISRDLSIDWRIELEGGSWTTGLDILNSYVSAGEKLLLGKNAELDWIVAEGRLALLDLATDPRRLRDRIDWVAKYELLKMFSQEVGEWDEPKLQSVELEYHNLNPHESLFQPLVDSGETVSVVPQQRILDAMTAAPMDTRACLRGALVQHASADLDAIGWRRATFKSDSDPRVVEFAAEMDSNELPRLMAAVQAWRKTQTEAPLE